MVAVKHTKQMSCKDHGKGCRVNTQLGPDDGMSHKNQRLALNKRFRKFGRMALRNYGDDDEGVSLY